MSLTVSVGSLAEELAGFVAAARLDDVPASVRDRMKDHVIDVAGCVLAGYETAWGRAVVEWVRDLRESGEARVWGSDVTGAASSSALALGVLGHSLDFDDYHAGGKLHPGAVVLPAAFSLGESLGRSGGDVMLAGVLGFETMIRLSLACGPVDTMLRGFHLTGICGGVGAAAAAARLLGLDAERTAHALTLGATQGAGLMGFAHDGSESKRLHAGRAAQSGILAAELAARGFTGPRRGFELEHGGFCHAFAPDPEPGRLVQELGVRWVAGEVSMKRYSCCGSIHSTLDLVAEAAAALGISAGEIEAIEVGHSPAVMQQCGWEYEPGDVLHAQMSLQYCVAILLLEGAVLPRQFRRELLADPRVLSLARRVRCTPDEEVARLYPERFASRVVLRAGGREIELRTEHPRGSPEKPLSSWEVDAKFLGLAADRLSPGRARAVVAGARDLDRCSSVPEFSALLTVEGGEQV
ncbi:MAG: MmgE/PrpD family protein [Gemmatimonadetes bacterium]|nr:MmgE/PrpD family protein [Gemmatimonadota bacterium]